MRPWASRPMAAAPTVALDPILCPCDFSAVSPDALRAATRLARAFGAGIVGLHVLPTTLPAAGGFRALPNPALLRPRLGEELSRALDGALQPSRAASVPTKAELREGRPAETILEVAEALPAGLIVIGTHSRSTLDRAVLGSVAETVLRKATCPVLAVPPGFPAGATWPRAVLWARDFSPDALAERYALAIVDRSGAETVVAVGTASQEILALARERAVDLIVLGASGTGALQRLRFGSTVMAVVRHSACPVLVVRR
jgi:universal stress protein A